MRIDVLGPDPGARHQTGGLMAVLGPATYATQVAEEGFIDAFRVAGRGAASTLTAPAAAAAV